MKKDRIESAGVVILVVAVIAAVIFAFCWYLGRFFINKEIVETIMNTSFATICCCGALLYFGGILMICLDGLKESYEWFMKKKLKGES